MIAIIIPVYKLAERLTDKEKLSLAQTVNVFKEYRIILLTHAGVDIIGYQNIVKEKQLHAQYFDKAFFEGVVGYNKLMLSLNFYLSFKNYKYILICQLDVFVFANKLEYFIRKDVDYVGAPWFEGFDKATHSSKIVGMGNGGFSLRKVHSFISILSIVAFLENPAKVNFSILVEVLKHPVSLLRFVKHQLLLKKRGYMSLMPKNFPYYEDVFWASYIGKMLPWFKLASIDDAIAFAFEANPRILFELNGKKLPMAVHAWEKYDPCFWQPIIDQYTAPCDSEKGT